MKKSDKEWLARKIREESAHERGLMREAQSKAEKDQGPFDPTPTMLMPIYVHRATARAFERLAKRIESS